MTQEEIISMAREAGGEDWGIFRDFMPEIERFAKLVAEKERKEFAVHAVDIARRAIAEEREACAKVCENSDRYRGEYFAEKIRARGQA